MRPLGVELAAMLADRGLGTVFGIPGVHNIELYRGIEDAGLTHILARNEMGAAFMADGYARASARPGVAFVITGPGLTNAMTPIGQAYSDSVPMLVIATCLDDTIHQQGQLHQMKDQVGAGDAIADWSEIALSPEDAYALIDRALEDFRTARARPKIIHVPIGVMGAPAPAFPPAPEIPPLPTCGTEDMASVVDHLTAARRPLIVFGGGAKAALAGPLLDRTGAASFTTYAGRGIVAAGRPLHFGSYLARSSSRDVAASADLVLAIGTELSETDLWRGTLGGNAPMIRVDIDPDVIARSSPALGIQADAAAFVAALTDALDPEPMEKDWSPNKVAAHRSTWRRDIASEFPGLLPVIEAVEDALGPHLQDDLMIFSDMTQFAYAAKEVWDMDRPGRWHHPYGFGTLGFGLPAGIGGALGHNGPVMVIAGDSGLQYSLQELGTAAELGLSLPILLWDNDALKMIEDGMIAAQFAPNAVHQLNPDWKALAAAYRIGFLEPSSLDDIASAFDHAFRAGRPTLVRLTPALSSSS